MARGPGMRGFRGSAPRSRPTQGPPTDPIELRRPDEAPTPVLKREARRARRFLRAVEEGSQGGRDLSQNARDRVARAERLADKYEAVVRERERDHISVLGQPFGRAPRTAAEHRRAAAELQGAKPGSLAETARELSLRKAAELEAKGGRR